MTNYAEAYVNQFKLDWISDIIEARRVMYESIQNIHSWSNIKANSESASELYRKSLNHLSTLDGLIDNKV